MGKYSEKDICELVDKSLDKLEGSKVCGCYHCCNIYDKSEIFEFYGESPVCPYCGIDSVIGEESLGTDITEEILEDMRNVMFGGVW